MGTSVTLALSLLEERHQAMGRNRNPMWWDWSTAFQHFHHNHYWGMGVRTISGSQLGWKAKHPNTRHPTCMPAVKGSAYQLEMRSIFCRGRFGLLVSSPAALYLLHLGPPCPNSMLVTQVAIASEAVSYILSAVNSPRPKLCPGGSHSYVPTC